METIENFDYYRNVPLVAIPQTDTPVVRSNKGLYEVWIVPAGKVAMSTSFALLLINHYQGINNEHESLLDPVARYDRLASEFAVGLHPSEVCFRFSLLETKNGPVVSVVFGSKFEMCDFDTVSDEASD